MVFNLYDILSFSLILILNFKLSKNGGIFVPFIST